MFENTSYNALLAKLNLNSEQETFILWIYNEVGDRVADSLQNIDFNDPLFEPYDIVYVTITNLLEELQTSKDYHLINQLVNTRYDDLYTFLSYGYGTPQEIFDDFKETIN